MVARGPLLDDMAKLMTNAAGVAQGMRREAEGAFVSVFERWLAERDVPSREELESVREMARLAREENEALSARIVSLEAALGKGKGKASDPTASDETKGSAGGTDIPSAEGGESG